MAAKTHEPRKDNSELIDKLTEGIASLTTSEKWREYLEFQSRFTGIKTPMQRRSLVTTRGRSRGALSKRARSEFRSLHQ